MTENGVLMVGSDGERQTWRALGLQRRELRPGAAGVVAVDRACPACSGPALAADHPDTPGSESSLLGLTNTG